MGSSQHSKRSDNKRCNVDVRWSIFVENLTVSLLYLRAVVNIPIQTLKTSPRLFFRKITTSQLLDLGPPAIRSAMFDLDLVWTVGVGGGGGVKKGHLVFCFSSASSGTWLITTVTYNITLLSRNASNKYFATCSSLWYLSIYLRTAFYGRIKKIFTLTFAVFNSLLNYDYKTYEIAILLVIYVTFIFHSDL